MIFSTIVWTLTFRLRNGWHCTIWVHSHLRFGQLLHGLKSSIMGYVPIFYRLRGLKSSRNSSRLKNSRCELSLSQLKSHNLEKLLMYFIASAHVGPSRIGTDSEPWNTKALMWNDMCQYWKGLSMVTGRQETDINKLLLRNRRKAKILGGGGAGRVGEGHQFTTHNYFLWKFASLSSANGVRCLMDCCHFSEQY